MVERSTTVSFDDEPLILVDGDDNVLGHGRKADVHAGEGRLHRAFSIFVFDTQGRVLLHQRSAQKTLWPLFWSNSCCSHPRRGETIDSAAERRLREELGLEAQLRPLYKFVYNAPFVSGDSDTEEGALVGTEHEMCSVLVGRADGPPTVNASEIADWSFVEAGHVDAQLTRSPERYTPWFKLEWPRIRGDHWRDVQAL